MKRSGPLKRYTPLQQKSGLKQKSQIRKSRSSKSDFTAATREAVAYRSGGRCEAGVEKCFGTASHIHHIRRRKCGDNSLENALHVCIMCHNWIHSNVAQSEERGWLIRCN